MTRIAVPLVLLVCVVAAAGAAQTVPAYTPRPVTPDSIVPLQELDASDRPVLIPNSCRFVIVPAARRGEPLEGEVDLMFVINTKGRIDTNSVQVDSATAPVWIPYARRDLLSCRYRPGQRYGEPVAVLTGRRFRFERVRRSIQ